MGVECLLRHYRPFRQCSRWLQSARGGLMTDDELRYARLANRLQHHSLQPLTTGCAVQLERGRPLE